MKALTVFFWTTVGVISASFVMSIYTAVEKHRAEQSAPRTIPVPAMGQ